MKTADPERFAPILQNREEALRIYVDPIDWRSKISTFPLTA
jgi:hypothetical protein